MSDIISAVFNGELIENYPHDLPYPSRLVLIWATTGPIHVVFAESSENFVVITVYAPTLEKWDDKFKTRK